MILMIKCREKEAHVSKVKHIEVDIAGVTTVRESSAYED